MTSSRRLFSEQLDLPGLKRLPGLLAAFQWASYHSEHRHCDQGRPRNPHALGVSCDFGWGQGKSTGLKLQKIVGKNPLQALAAPERHLHPETRRLGPGLKLPSLAEDTLTVDIANKGNGLNLLKGDDSETSVLAQEFHSIALQENVWVDETAKRRPIEPVYYNFLGGGAAQGEIRWEPLLSNNSAGIVSFHR